MVRKNLFKDWKLLISETNKFLKSYRTMLAQEAKKTSIYFEMTCYNYIAKYYETNKFKLEPKNLESSSGAFLYKLSPTGYPSNFSYFRLLKEYRRGTPKRFTFELRQNIAIQSSHSDEIFVTPDFVVAKEDSLDHMSENRYFRGARKLYYYAARNVVTFAESKNYNPSPELVLNYVGIINEIFPNIVTGNEIPDERPTHLAPTLMISGAGGYHTDRIKYHLTSRYKMNVFFGLFYYRSQVYSEKNRGQIQKIGTNREYYTETKTSPDDTKISTGAI